MFTLDTNCIIDLENESAFAQPLRRLIEAHKDGIASVALPSIAASELQKGGTYLESFDEFTVRVQAAGLGDLPLVQPIACWNIGFYGQGYWANGGMIELEKRIHEMHPDIAFDLQEHCVVAEMLFLAASVLR